MAKKSNQFAELLNKRTSEQVNTPAPRPSAGRGKHIGGYFDPAIARQIKSMAVEEDTTVQELLAEALDMLFESRNKPAITRQG